MQVFNLIVDFYCILERRYVNLYSDTLGWIAKLVCLIEITMHVLTLFRLSWVVDQSPSQYSAYFLSWMTFYCLFSLLCLCVMFAALIYKCSCRMAEDERDKKDKRD